MMIQIYVDLCSTASCIHHIFVDPLLLHYKYIYHLIIIWTWHVISQPHMALYQDPHKKAVRFNSRGHRKWVNYTDDVYNNPYTPPRNCVVDWSNPDPATVTTAGGFSLTHQSSRVESSRVTSSRVESSFPTLKSKGAKLHLLGFFELSMYW